MDRVAFKSFSPNLEDIESRIIILKRRAAEADFLREERDMLLNRLKLYSNDYIFPEIQNVEKLKEENDELRQKIQELQVNVNSLEEEVYEIQILKEELKTLTEENVSLKEDLAKLATLEHEVDKLLSDKNQLKADFDNVMSVVSSEDPIGKCKEQIKSLYERAQKLRNERDKLQEQLIEREVKIDIMEGKISHLNARLNERLLSARFKAEQGQILSAEEDLVLTVHRLETTNRSMSAEIAELTTKLNAALSGTVVHGSSEIYEELYTLRKLEADETLDSQEGYSTRPAYLSQDVRQSLREKSSGFIRVEVSCEHLPTTNEMIERLEEIRADKEHIDQYHRKLCHLKSNFDESKDQFNYQTEAISRVYSRLGAGLFQSSHIF